jgi:hypothetical protein
MTEIVTYIEMTAPDQFNPAAPVHGLTLERIDPRSSLVPDVITRIGAPYGWKRAGWTEADWAAWLPRKATHRRRKIQPLPPRHQEKTRKCPREEGGRYASAGAASQDSGSLPNTLTASSGLQ